MEWLHDSVVERQQLSMLPSHISSLCYHPTSMEGLHDSVVKHRPISLLPSYIYGRISWLCGQTSTALSMLPSHIYGRTSRLYGRTSADLSVTARCSNIRHLLLIPSLIVINVAVIYLFPSIFSLSWCRMFLCVFSAINEGKNYTN